MNPIPQNTRLDFLMENTRPSSRRSMRYNSSYSSASSNEPWSRVKHSRRDINTPMSLPTHSSTKPIPVPNNRLSFLNEPPIISNKKTFVSMPNQSQWESGYRPAWMLRTDKNPPEKYEDGLKIYKTYMKTGVISFQKFNKFEDKVKNHTANFMAKNNSKKVK